jgi:hypothetical protein
VFCLADDVEVRHDGYPAFWNQPGAHRKNFGSSYFLEVGPVDL